MFPAKSPCVIIDLFLPANSHCVGLTCSGPPMIAFISHSHTRRAMEEDLILGLDLRSGSVFNMMGGNWLIDVLCGASGFWAELSVRPSICLQGCMCVFHWLGVCIYIQIHSSPNFQTHSFALLNDIMIGWSLLGGHSDITVSLLLGRLLETVTCTVIDEHTFITRYT
jgi:hypothetical protein